MSTELLHSSVQQRARELLWLDELFGITRSTAYRAGGPGGAALGQATSGRPSVTGLG